MTTVQIKITHRLGEALKVEVLNGEGRSCQDLTQPLEQLGASQTTLKAEYYQEAAVELTQPLKLD